MLFFAGICVGAIITVLVIFFFEIKISIDNEPKEIVKYCFIHETEDWHPYEDITDSGLVVDISDEIREIEEEYIVH